jgi:tetratricopeptide (TPR) repeat protein|mmetsp:Transcript_38002/g.60210  ORF Transcript_38002/g.60210 Transcript_38002/m.60210 type:complete len:293 (+) Transcript_38002:70-948(+)|eukprot:CAMPEP_0169141626 /NCGR_PEP_ID=MMETSP1015-20121227/44427_1 /TAXON_ID=342587 /ORGANISM="Karlodinium micrum, Strain CCMP2283" /LENGTH=292 /DNA_ID=CAMNT_0009208059 /DNA_START=18 /DNA_END=896 /DNA_ORIENTATION=+
MEPGEFDALKEKANRSDASAMELLQFMRTHKLSQPELVLQHGGKLLQHPGKLKSEQWTVYEQVFFSACAAGNEKWRDHCLAKLTTRWPNSTRVERLKGMKAESSKKYSEAIKIYDAIIEKRPEDTVAWKRRIAVTKQLGPVADTIAKINEYLDAFASDSEVWHELAELYIEAGSLSRALFCFEELVLHNPRNIYHVLTHAELLYSTGDYLQARQYYSFAAYLDGTNLRGLWGMVAVSMALAEKTKTSDNQKKLDQLQDMACEKLERIYKGIGAHGKIACALLGTEFRAPKAE